VRKPDAPAEGGHAARLDVVTGSEREHLFARHRRAKAWQRLPDQQRAPLPDLAHEPGDRVLAEMSQCGRGHNRRRGYRRMMLKS